MPARYKKLHGGRWGVVITGEEASGIEVGDRLEVWVRRRLGDEKLVTVSAVWKGKNLYAEGDVVLAVFAKAEGSPAGPRGA